MNYSASDASENSDELINTAMNNLATCPVCGYKLGFLPWGPFGDQASHEICPCCFTEFGYDDDAALEEPRDRKEVWKELRERWISNGMKWGGKASDKLKDYSNNPKYEKYSKELGPPKGWNPVEQLRKLMEGQVSMSEKDHNE